VVHVWKSASKTGDTKTPKSKRSLILPKRAITALMAHKVRQERERAAAGAAWRGTGLVFCHEDGTMYKSDALNWRFSSMTRKVGLGHWHAHEGRHTAVSIMRSNGVPIQEISGSVGHKSTHVTETVYRHVIVPAIQGGAMVMDDVFDDEDDDGDERRSALVAIDRREVPKPLDLLIPCSNRSDIADDLAITLHNLDRASQDDRPMGRSVRLRCFGVVEVLGAAGGHQVSSPCHGLAVSQARTKLSM
jgi:hypothetical protein